MTAAYDLPGGALTMLFTANNLVPAPDESGAALEVIDISHSSSMRQMVLQESRLPRASHQSYN